MLNHALVDGQMHGGIVQGLGQVFGEQCVYDRATGQLLTGSFMDYAMPRAAMLREARSTTTRCRRPTIRSARRARGEAGTTGAVPAAGERGARRAAPLGIHHLDFPYTPGRIWHAIAAAKRRV